MTTDITVGSGARGPRPPALRRLTLRAVMLALVCAAAGACGLKPEARIDDPDCEYCYQLPSGVKYKTYPYYAP